MSAARAEPKSAGQVRAIFGLARRAGHSDEDRHAVIASITDGRTDSVKDLTFDEANSVIEHYGGNAFKPAPRRTVLYRRQKGGVKQLVSQSQLELLASLASQRNWSAEALTKFCERQCGHYPLRTTEDANKVIEALKAMNRREGLWAA